MSKFSEIPELIEAAPDRPILFILETRNKFEEKLLNEWLTHEITKKSNNNTISRVTVHIRSSAQSSKLEPLQTALGTHVDTLVIPLRVAWTLPADKTNKPFNLRHFLPGDPRNPGQLRARSILAKDPSRMHLLAGESASISDLRIRFERKTTEQGENSVADFANFVARQATIVMDLAERKLRGSRYKVPRFITENLLASPKFQKAVAALAQEENRTVADIIEEAKAYMKEVISVPTPLFIDLKARFDRYILTQGYEPEMVMSEKDLAKLKKIVQENPSLIVWTHKTYLDGSVVPAFLYKHDFPIAHIFGGVNMAFAGLGTLMRRSGGIFIRRTFQDNHVYKLVLRHYIGYLMEKRFPLQWSFEGTRSRVGKLMPPRYGLLKYTLEGAWATDSTDINIIPVSISFDQIVDVEEYATEQTGRIKSPETLKWLLGYIKSLRKPSGRIYVDIGDPVVLDEAPHPDDRLALSKIAFNVAVNTNKVSPITLPSMVSMILLGAAPRALTVQEIEDQSKGLILWALERGIRVSSDFAPKNSDHLSQITEVLVENGLLIRYDEGSSIVYAIAQDQQPIASYYRNMIIHHYLHKAIIEMSLTLAAKTPSEQSSTVFWDEVFRLRDYLKFEFFYPPKEDFKAEIETELSRVDTHWSDKINRGHDGIEDLLDQMHPWVAHASLLTFVEAYTVIFDLLARKGNAQAPDIKSSVNLALTEGRQAWLQRRITSEASIGKILFENGYKLAENLGLTDVASENIYEKRIEKLNEFKEIAARLNSIRAGALGAMIENPILNPIPAPTSPKKHDNKVD